LLGELCMIPVAVLAPNVTSQIQIVVTGGNYESGSIEPVIYKLKPAINKFRSSCVLGSSREWVTYTRFILYLRRASLQVHRYIYLVQPCARCMNATILIKSRHSARKGTCISQVTKQSVVRISKQAVKCSNKTDSFRNLNHARRNFRNTLAIFRRKEVIRPLTEPADDLLRW
jgi:hypothetical protein